MRTRSNTAIDWRNDLKRMAKDGNKHKTLTRVIYSGPVIYLPAHTKRASDIVKMSQHVNLYSELKQRWDDLTAAESDLLGPNYIYSGKNSNGRVRWFYHRAFIEQAQFEQRVIDELACPGELLPFESEIIAFYTKRYAVK